MLYLFRIGLNTACDGAYTLCEVIRFDCVIVLMRHRNAGDGRQLLTVVMALLLCSSIPYE